jgi:hypothetical protein
MTVDPTTTTTSTTTITNFNDVNTASSETVSGLSLSLYLDSKTYQQGQQVSIAVYEKNTLKTTNIIASSTKWPVSGLRVGPCGTLNYPFGFAIFQGNYTATNVSSATPLQIYQPATYTCPATIGNISSYVFQPLSDTASVFQMSESTAVFNNMEMNTEFEPGPRGYWASNNIGAAFTLFDPGVYTVVAGDEWGALVVVHFTVSQ